MLGASFTVGLGTDSSVCAAVLEDSLVCTSGSPGAVTPAPLAVPCSSLLDDREESLVAVTAGLVGTLALKLELGTGRIGVSPPLREVCLTLDETSEKSTAMDVEVGGLSLVS